MDECREAAIAATWLGLQGDKESRQAIDRYLSTWRFIQPETDGGTLQSLGMPPGPSYRRILSTLRAAWIDGLIQSKMDEEALLQELIEVEKSNG
jgi:tRNA nucleotidyltransferase (CCA-adding enzyme)